MATELQRRKVERVFLVMDANGDGLVEREDILNQIENWRRVRGLEPGSRDHERLVTLLSNWWEVLLALNIDIVDGKAGVDHLLDVVDMLEQNREAEARLAAMMFDILDEDHDGRISAEEHGRFVEVWTGRQVDPDVFAQLDDNADGELSRSEFVQLWWDFWHSQDPEVPGTWLFGRFEMPGKAAPAKGSGGRHRAR